jgi:hypothetical protein
MKRVARSEAGFLRFLQLLITGAPTDTIAHVLLRTNVLRPRIGPTAMGLVQDALAKGTVRLLAHGGGWRPETRPVGDDVATGPLWTRRPVEAIAFGPWSFALLRWAYTEALVSPSRPPDPPETWQTGDHLVAWMVARALATTGLHGSGGAVARSPLAALALAGACPSPEPDWPAWLEAHDVLLEGLQEALGRAWADGLRSLLAGVEPAEVATVGTAQRELIEPLLDALSTRGRLDLADFLWVAGEQLVPDPDHPPTLAPTLRASRSLRERQAAQDVVAAALALVVRLERSLEAARTTRFFDDDYDAAQARLARFERFGTARATVFRAAVEGLRA